MPELYKLARPLMRGVPVEITANRPRFITDKGRADISNHMVNDILGGLPQFRGELVVGNPIAEDCYAVTREFVDNATAINLFVFWVYDLRTVGHFDLRRRLEIVQPFIETCGINVQYVDHELIESIEALEKYKQKVIGENKFPGIVLREPFGTYDTEDQEIPAQVQ
jgi:hypothetical protein